MSLFILTKNLPKNSGFSTFCSWYKVSVNSACCVANEDSALTSVSFIVIILSDVKPLANTGLSTSFGPLNWNVTLPIAGALVALVKTKHVAELIVLISFLIYSGASLDMSKTLYLASAATKVSLSCCFLSIK